LPNNQIPLIQAFAGQRDTPPPIWLMRQAGRYLPEYREIRKNVTSFLDLCFTPELAIEVTLQPIRRFAMDAAILFSDILVIPHALGQKVDFVEGQGPVLEPVRNLDDVHRLSASAVHERLAPVYETVRGVTAELPDSVGLIGFAGAPWTVATYMVEGGTSRNFAKVKRWAYGAPEEFAVLVDLLVESTAEYLIEQVRNGARVIQIFDTWAGALHEDALARWCLEPTLELARRIKAVDPNVRVIVFPRGAATLYARYARAPEIDGLSIDSAVERAWAKAELQPHCAVQGNLDPISLLAGGDQLRDQANAILSSFAGGPFIFNLGHGILPETPPDNVARLIDTVRGWNC
jgi:uroporphyrinogen decarboxylase